MATRMVFKTSTLVDRLFAVGLTLVMVGALMKVAEAMALPTHFV